MESNTFLFAPQGTTALPTSLNHIVEELTEHRSLKPNEIRRIVLEAKVQAEDLMPWADFDHPVADSYGRKLVHHGGNFEVMVMSWRPGDFSTIHDHGSTQWGAVQIFGPAEHATFRVEDDSLSTLARWQVQPGDVVGVSHSLVHQMGNPTSDQRFLSLHVYGLADDIDSVTGDARVFDLENNTIQRVDGGVFFALPPAEVKRVEPAPTADFPTRLRHMVELVRRLQKMEDAGQSCDYKNLAKAIEDTFSVRHLAKLRRHLRDITDGECFATNSIAWRILNFELREAAKLQRSLRDEPHQTDRYHQYAARYDAVIGRTALDGFMAKYLQFFTEKMNTDRADSSLISLGCGTGLVESFLVKKLGFSRENMYGIDLSEAMVMKARRHIRADVGDVLTLDPGVRMWDVAFSGLHVFQYLPAERLQEAIQKTASIVKPGGWFVGDFVTPDHIRRYPNVVQSADGKVISLRSTRLSEQHGAAFQDFDIVNVDTLDGSVRITDGGSHRRFLPAMHRVRGYFENAFGGSVELYDALSLEPIPATADTCPSTRYVVIAKK